MQHLLWVDVSNLSDNSIAVIIFIVAIVIVGCYLQIVIGRESVRRKIKKLRTLLHEYGIDAQLAEKHCPEEIIGSRGRFIPGPLAWVSGGDSAAVLNISTGPIGWVNLLEYQFGDSPTDNWYVYTGNGESSGTGASSSEIFILSSRPTSMSKASSPSLETSS